MDFSYLYYPAFLTEHTHLKDTFLHGAKLKILPFSRDFDPITKNTTSSMFGLSYLCIPASSHHKLQARPHWSWTQFQTLFTHPAKPFCPTELENLFNPFSRLVHNRTDSLQRVFSHQYGTTPAQPLPVAFPVNMLLQKWGTNKASTWQTEVVLFPKYGSNFKKKMYICIKL